jgi:hypothetical protein
VWVIDNRRISHQEGFGNHHRAFEGTLPCLASFLALVLGMAGLEVGWAMVWLGVYKQVLEAEVDSSPGER